MKILIIEDEEPAAKRLFKMVKEIEPEAALEATLESVESSIQWFEDNPMPELVLSDIQLSDGTSFDIFRQIEISCPIIFITAYDQYAIEAFKVNSIDYLLKPVKKEELTTALKKYRKSVAPVPQIDLGKLLLSINQPSHIYKQRFVVKYGEHLKTIMVQDVAYFYTEDKVNFLVTSEGRRFAIDFNLDTLDGMLDPKNFFRINRQFIISIGSISEMFAYSKSRVLIKLNPTSKHETIVSSERSAQFKAWLGDSN